MAIINMHLINFVVKFNYNNQTLQIFTLESLSLIVIWLSAHI